jgi:DNA (cytosine-5)-methyltransferase 1
MPHEGGVIVDLFAGGGGASLGIEMAIGRPVDVAINHDPEAIALHTLNHPHTKHLCSDIWEVAPLDVARRGQVELLWASPDCTYHSKARGGKPFRDLERATGRRSLAEAIIPWAAEVAPDTIILENVEEFRWWGPLDADGKPDQAHKGRDFDAFVQTLAHLGYIVEWKTLRACDFGAPTVRRRLFLIAKRGSYPVWPDPTHGPGKLPYRTAAECLDWSVPCPSIYARERPLADKTLARIARGLQRFVVDDPRRLLVTVRGELVSPALIHSGNGERPGQAPRIYDPRAPLNTIMAEGVKVALVACYLVKNNGGHEATGQRATDPIATLTTRNQIGKIVASLVRIGKFDYRIADIGYRMLQPRELFRGQGFPDTYSIGDFTKEVQIRMAGNSVCPPVAAALARANVRRSARAA